MKTIIGRSIKNGSMKSDCVTMACSRCGLFLNVPIPKMTFFSQEEYAKFSQEEKERMKNEIEYIHPECASSNEKGQS